MGEPSTRHNGPPLGLDSGTYTQPPAQDQLIADELPMSEDDYALAVQSSRVLLQQINNRRHLSQYQRQHPRHRQRDTGRSVEKLAHGLNRHNLKQRDTPRHTASPLRSCMKSGCSPPTTVPTTPAHRSLERDVGNEGVKETDSLKSDAGTGSSFTNLNRKLECLKPGSASHTVLGLPADSIPIPEGTSHDQPREPRARANTNTTTPTLLEADSDQEMDEDEGFFDGPDDLLRLGEERNEGMATVGAYRQRGLLRFRQSSEAATSCSAVVRNIPRMRRRKRKKMEVRSRAATIPDSDLLTHTTNHGHV